MKKKKKTQAILAKKKKKRLERVLKVGFALDRREESSWLRDELSIFYA